MTLTPRLCAEIMRQRLGLPDGKKAAGIIIQIPEALKIAARKIAADPSTRPLLMSDKTTAKISVTAGGKVSLTSGYTTYRFLKEFIEYGQMYMLSAINFSTSQVDVSNDTITLTGDRVAVNDAVQFTSTGSLPGGLSLATTYYVRSYDSTTGNITLKADLATTSSRIDLTSQGTGTHTLTVTESADFPLQKLAGPQVAPFDRYLETLYRYYYIQGDVMQLFPRNITGQVAFAVPSFPATLSQLPSSTEAENIFLDTLFNLVTAKQQAQ